jgi:hypothetical protein
MLLVIITAYMPIHKRNLADSYNINDFEPEYMDMRDLK